MFDSLPAKLAAFALALCGASPGPGAEVRDLRIALPGNADTLAPDKSTTVTIDLNLAAHSGTSLVDRGPDMKLMPGLANAWEPIGDTATRTALCKELTRELCEASTSILPFFTPISYAQSKTIDRQARGDDRVRAIDVKAR